MIFFLTKSSDEIGKIKEHLKWGAPSYVIHRSKSGSTLIEVLWFTQILTTTKNAELSLIVISQSKVM